MTLRRRSKFQGVSPEASKELIAFQDDLLLELAQMRQFFGSIGTLPIEGGSYSARLGDLVRSRPGTGDTVNVVFPQASSKNATRRIAVLHVGAGTTVIAPTVGAIDGAAKVTVTTAGLRVYESVGAEGWWQSSVGGGGGGGLTPIADEQFLANTSGVAATPVGTNLSSLAGTGLAWNSGTNALDVSGGSGISLAVARKLITYRVGP